jgi:MYXO-CTERM domain-containing protein
MTEVAHLARLLLTPGTRSGDVCRKTLRLLSVAWLGALAAACSEADEADGALRGSLVVVVVDAEGSEGGPRYFLRVDATEEVVPLAFRGSVPKPQSGARLAVNGAFDGDTLNVESYAVEGRAAGLGRVKEPVLQAGPRTRDTVLIPLDFGDGVEVNDDPVGYFERIMFSTTNPGPRLGFGASDRSMAQYFSEASFGKLLTPGEVAPITDYSGNPCQNYGSPMASALRADIGAFDGYIWFYGTEQGSPCGGGGWGAQGTWNDHQRDLWMNGNVWPTAIPHEVGHNIGLMHASSMRCGGQPFADDPRTCDTEEYGNPFNIMGNGGVGHMSGMEKWYTEIFEGCNGVRVRTSGSFNLLPIEIPCTGIQTLQVPMPKTRYYDTDQSSGSNPARFYYLELRTSVGLDTGMTPQVVVHVSDEIADPDDVCERSVVLDMTPETSGRQLPQAGFEGLKAGQSFEDPAGGVSFSVESIASTGAMVTVTLANGTGTTTCMDGEALVGSGPASCEDTGGTGGSGGMGGSAGTAGSSGASGASGAAGQGGAAGNAGASTGGVAGTAGVAGAGGVTAGAAGDAGNAGAGSGGSAGQDVAGGAAGVAGNAGAAGSGGVSGGAGSGAAGAAGSTAGSAGMAGTAGNAGAGGAAGNAGASGGGLGGLGGASAGANAAGSVNAKDGAPNAESGCGCRVPSRGSGSLPLLPLSLLGLFAALRRRASVRAFHGRAHQIT